jgi:hypothetical protein
MAAFGTWADFKRVGGKTAQEERGSRETLWRVGHGVSRGAVLRGSQYRTLRILGQRTRDEIAFWIEVVLAGFIDHSNLIMRGCFRVGDDTTELSQFQ